MSELVNSSRRDTVAIVSMNNPNRKNAMDSAMLTELVSKIREVAKDDSQALVITGEGDVFSSGADVSEKVDRDGGVRRMQLFCDLYEAVTRFPKPTVAAVTGPCIGGGAEVAAGCDLRVGTPESRIKFPGAQFGIPIGAARLELLIGLSHSKDLLLTSRVIDGHEAYRLGFLNRLANRDSYLGEAVELAAQIAGNPGVLQQKRLLDEASGLSERLSAENRALMRWQRRG